MPQQILLSHGMPSAFISMIEFSQGLFVGYYLNMFVNYLYNNKEIEKNKTKNILFILLEIFLSGLLIHTIRQLNIKYLHGKVLHIKTWPPPIACGFGLWSLQSSLKDRIDSLIFNELEVLH